MEVASVVQGSREWLQLRAAHYTASEAPAALGVSKYQTRAALLRQKHTGIGEDVDEQKQSLFDRGHAAEATARALAEQIIGEELFPVTATKDVDGLPLLASLDGATLNEDLIFEHKLWSESLAADVRNGALSPHYTVQMDQQLLVTGAEKCLFMVSDGTPERMVWCWYESTPAKFAALVAGWRQFIADLMEYEPSAHTPAVTAAPQEHLPAVSVQVNGTLAVVSNLAPFGVALRAFIEKIPKKPNSDQEFADTDAACKRLKEAEDRLQQAEDAALSSMGDVEAMRRMVAEFRELARTTRLASEKLVAARKVQIREEEVMRGTRELGRHLKALNDRLGAGNFMPDVPMNFAAVIKGLKTLDSVRNAIDTELARAKIDASAIADKIDANLKAMSTGCEGFCGLFPDMKALALKEPDDLAAVIALRVAQRKASLEAERTRIAAEEAARIEREARAAAEQRGVAGAERRPGTATETTQRGADSGSAQQPANGAGDDAKRIGGPAIPQSTTPTLPLGQLCERLDGILVSADLLARLGFPFTRDKASKLYRESDFSAICAALAEHCLKVGEASHAQP